MKKILVPFADTHQFSNLIDDYLNGSDSLRPFYRYIPEVEVFEKVISDRKKFPCDRKLLSAQLIRQYGSILNGENPDARLVTDSIKKLENDNCFTVTTGHQLNIFTGPLYAIYKIATTIKLAQILAERYPGNQFVPVFWMATEDHDLEEINHTNIFGTEVIWMKEPGGAVGRMNLEGMAPLLENVRGLMGDKADCLKLFESSYIDSSTLAEATRKIINTLFGSYGLIVVDGDDRELKKSFVAEMRDDLLQHTAYQAVNATSARLANIHKNQVQPRQINLFYLAPGSRERIERTDDGVFRVLNSKTNLKFSKESILKELEEHPEHFSPNVVLRPLYQEKILPNLAYIGGPGELNYWLQFMDAFDSNKIAFPVLILRNCMMLLNKNTLGKVQKLGLSIPELFMSNDYLVLKVLESSADLHISTTSISALIQKEFDSLSKELARLDASLVASVEAERQKTLNSISNLEEKARRALKRKNETVVSQVKNLKEKLFPGGNLQERTDNFLPYYCQDQVRFINEIISHSNPFEKEFIVLTEE